MRKTIFLILAISFLLACGRDSSPYLITANKVGPLTKEIRINQLDSVFKNDSVVRNLAGNRYLGAISDIEIYDKDGTPLLILEPVQQFDTTSTISYIQILDSRYKTAKGINTNSSFGDILENYSISRIENTLNSAVVFIDELNLYLTIDKKELPSSLRYDTDTQITASQIPDNAKIKYLMISW